MFNLDTALDVRFGFIGTNGTITVTFPNNISFSGTRAIVTGGFNTLFEIVDEGSETPTIINLGDPDGPFVGLTNRIEHDGNAISFIPSGHPLGSAAASGIANLINSVSKTGSTQAQVKSGVTGFTPARIRSLCTATANGNTVTIETDFATLTNFAVQNIFMDATAFTNGAATVLDDEKTAMASFGDNRTYVSTTARDIEIFFTKPINSVFIYLPTPMTSANTITAMFLQKPDGSTINLPNFVDGTEGLTQSGFLYWTPEKDVYDNVQSGEIYSIKVGYTDNIDATFGGINLLFCDKFDLLREYPDLDNLLDIADERVITPQLVRLMESTMLEIEKKIQNSPFWKEDRQYFFTAKELDRWDLLQINEINQAAIFWTIGKIFYFLSDTPGDIYSVKAGDYRARGEAAFASVNLSLDFNDNGSLDIFEGEREAANIEITFER